MATVYDASLENMRTPIEGPSGLGSASSENLDTFESIRMHPAVLTLERTADRIGILEPALNNRVGKYVTGLVSRMHTISNAMTEDISNSANPTIDKGVRTSMYTSQLIDRGRVPMILASNAAVDAFTWSKDGRWAGAAAGLVFGAWSGGLGEILHQYYKRMPRTVEAVQEEFPVAVDLMADALPGSRKKTETATSNETPIDSVDIDFDPTDELDSILETGPVTTKAKEKSLGKHLIRIATAPVRLPLNVLRRGFSATNFGSTAYVSTATFRGASATEARKQYANVMGFGGLFCAGLAWGVCERIDNLTEQGEYEQAQDLLNLVSNDWTWLKLGAASVALELGMAKLRRNKMLREGRINSSNESLEPVIS